MKPLLAIFLATVGLTFSAFAESPITIQGDYRCPQGISVTVAINDAVIRFPQDAVSRYPQIEDIDAPHSWTNGKASFYGWGDHVEFAVTEVSHGDIIVTVFEEPDNAQSRSNDIICLKDWQ